MELPLLLSLLCLAYASISLEDSLVKVGDGITIISFQDIKQSLDEATILRAKNPQVHAVGDEALRIYLQTEVPLAERRGQLLAMTNRWSPTIPLSKKEKIVENFVGQWTHAAETTAKKIGTSLENVLAIQRQIWQLGQMDSFKDGSDLFREAAIRRVVSAALQRSQ